MFGLGLFGLSLLINVGMVSANPGLCPFYPKVSSRDKTCMKTPTCEEDSDCKSTQQKCCENPCGVTLCIDVDPDPSEKIEKCPNPRLTDEPYSCVRKPTKFCYKGNCKRCCRHESSCNPAHELLKPEEHCHIEICRNHECPKQGSICYVDATTGKPLCKCNEKCSEGGPYVCATDDKNTIRTFKNECYMNKTACDKKESFKVKHKGRCPTPQKKILEIQRPTLDKASVLRLDIGKSVTINCYGFNDVVDLKWVQQRAGDVEVEVGKNLLINDDIYELEERKRKVLGLYIKLIGYGSYGLYSCKQTINRVVYATDLHIRPRKEVIFSRGSCKLEKENGTCGGNFTNYYYDSKPGENKCRPFRYQGCQGNKNNFQTLNECKVKCGGMLPSSDIAISIPAPDEKCGNKVCRFHEKCERMSNSNATCVCKQECSLNPKPICASDGRTYISLCTMKVEACRWRKLLTPVYHGKCGPLRPSNRPKTTYKTTLSLCQLKRCPPYAKCFVNPITKIPWCYCPETCPFSPQIICASNRKHYINECFMRHYSCKEKRKLTVLNKGLCNPYNNLGT